MTGEIDNMVTNDVCWLACFDILGFKNEMSLYRQYERKYGIKYLAILAGEYQERVLDYIEHRLVEQGRFADIPWYHAHFSDTLLFFSPGDSPDSYLTLDSVVRCFFYEMLIQRIAFRGALTCGEFYADRARGIFVGPALVDAYKYAEKQNWIGYVLTPQAREKLAGTRLCPAQSKDWAMYNVPVKVKVPVTATDEEPLFAYRLSECSEADNCIRQMEKEAKISVGEEIYSRECRPKFDHTKLFLKSTKLRSLSGLGDDNSE